MSTLFAQFKVIVSYQSDIKRRLGDTVTQILIVEDEQSIAEILAKFAQREGFLSKVLNEGSGVVEYIMQNHVDMLVLDIMLPNKDGLTICREVREFSDIPIILLTAKVNEAERLKGLKAGADDYVCKPFSAPELMLRIKAILKRSANLPTHNRVASLVESALKIDEEQMIVVINDNSAPLTMVEIALLKLLSNAPNRVYSRDTIMDKIYSDFRVVSDRTVDSHISKLRKKLNNLSPDHEYLCSVYGAGYKFIPTN